MPKKTHCKRGHPKTPENMYPVSKSCRICAQDRYYANAKKLCALSHEWRKNNKEKVSARQRQKRETNPEKEMWQRARKRAKKHGILFDLKTEDISVPAVCPVFLCPLIVGHGHTQTNSPSLDRIRAEEGYTKENIQVISELANRIKSNATPEQLLRVAMFMQKPRRIPDSACEWRQK